MSDFEDETCLSEFLHDLGTGLITLGWDVDAADRAVSYVRKAQKRGESFGEALQAVYRMKNKGQLCPEEAE